MKIVQLNAENFKKLSVVQIKPDGSLVQITGKNGQGKSSVLDAIFTALAGAAAAPPEPIKQGQQRAKIKLDLGDLVVTRSFARKEDGGYTTEIRVEAAGGGKLTSPQKVLDELIGSLSFDPLEFARKKPEEQFEILKAFVPGFDFADSEAQNRADYEKRTDYNRRAREERAAADAVNVPLGTPEALVDESDLVAQLAGAAEHNAGIAKRVANRKALADKIAAARTHAARVRQDAENLRLEAEQLEQAAANEELVAEADAVKLAAAPGLPTTLDTEKLRVQIETARTQNQYVAQLQQRAARLKLAEENEALAKTLTERIKARQAAKEAAIAAAKMPVAGLGFGHDHITLNGVPFKQASDAEQLRASVAIAMSLNPKLKVLGIRDGSLLDEDSLALLAKMLDEGDWQCWIERVDSSGKVGFVLEDGHLKGLAPPAAEPPAAAPPAPAQKAAPAAKAAPKAPAPKAPPPNTSSLLDEGDL